MKRYAVADEVPEEYAYCFTSGAEYKIHEEIEGDLAVIFDDENGPSIISLTDCNFLNGKSWRIVEREE